MLVEVVWFFIALPYDYWGYPEVIGNFYSNYMTQSFLLTAYRDLYTTSLVFHHFYLVRLVWVTE